MKLSTLLDENLIFLNQSFDNYDDILKFLADKFAETVDVSKEDILNSFIERNKIISTYLGNEVALPHAKFENFEDIKIAIITLKEPIKMESAVSGALEDCKYILSIIASSKMPDFYIKVLGSISNMCSDCTDILKSETPEELIAAVQASGLTTGKYIVAKDLITPTATISGDDTIAKALAILKEYKVNAIPVVENEKVTGILDVKRIIRYSMPKYVLEFDDFAFVNSDFKPLETLWENEQSTSVSNFIDHEYEHLILLDDTPYAEILFLFAKYAYTYLIIVDKDNQYVGIVLLQTILDKILLP